MLIWTFDIILYNMKNYMFLLPYFIMNINSFLNVLNRYFIKIKIFNFIKVLYYFIAVMIYLVLIKNQKL